MRHSICALQTRAQQATDAKPDAQARDAAANRTTDVGVQRGGISAQAKSVLHGADFYGKRRNKFGHSCCFVLASNCTIRNPPPMPDGDAIHISQLEISARVGVPEAERGQPQRLVVSLTLWPDESFDSLRDDLARTVDYAAVAKSIHMFVAPRCDKLIETLASALAAHLLERFAIRAVRIELRKFVVQNTEHVAVILTRARGDQT